MGSRTLCVATLDVFCSWRMGGMRRQGVHERTSKLRFVHHQSINASVVLRANALLSSTTLSRSPICVPLLASASAASLPRTPVCERTCSMLTVPPLSSVRVVGTRLVHVTATLALCWLFSNVCKSFIHGHTEQIRHRSQTHLVSAYGRGRLIWSNAGTPARTPAAGSGVPRRRLTKGGHYR